MPNLFKRQYIGHASHDGPYPENSLALYQYLVEELHYEIVEADVVFTVDGVPVLNHGIMLNVGEHGVDISKTKYADLKTYRIPNSRGEGAYKITSAEDFISFGRSENVIIMLDLTFQHYSYKNLLCLYNLVYKYEMRAQTIWGDADIAKLARIDRQLIVQSSGSWGRKLLLKSLFKSFFCDTLIMSFSYYGGEIEQFAKIVRWGHRLGFIMKVATINDKTAADRFWRIGTDLINTDTLLNPK